MGDEWPACYAAFLNDAPADLLPDQVVIQKIYNSGAHATVIETDTGILTKEELNTHKEAVTAAILTELQTWQKYGCFSRKA